MPETLTYEAAVGILGPQYVQHLWRQPSLVDCVAEVRGLEADCRAKGLAARAEAYAVIAKAMEQVAREDV